jgi:hypothetical protein
MGTRSAQASALIAIAVCIAVAACGAPPAPPPQAEAQAPAELRTGDVTVRATTLPTLRLNAAMARAYGVQPDPGSVLLVVGLRRGQQAIETSVPGTVTATASDLLGKRQQIALRAVDSGGYIDHVGVVRVAMPDTLRFRIEVSPQGAPAATLAFHRDFFPAQ